MSNPLISVIVPAFNVEPFILKCIQTILSSTVKDIEVIAVDDCSTDRTLELLESINDSRLRVLSQLERKGVSAARNIGIDNATGVYISFVDADDWVSPLMFEKLLDTAQKTDADIVFCGQYSVYDDKTVNTCDIKKDLQFTGKTGISQYIHMFIIKGKDEYKPYFFPMGQPYGTLYKADLILKNSIRFTEGMQYKEDVIFNMYAAQHSDKIIRLNEPLYYYNKCNRGSLTASELKKEMLPRIEKDIEERRKFLLRYRQEDEVFKAGYYNYVFRCMYKDVVAACIKESSYTKCRDFYSLAVCDEAMRNIRFRDLNPAEKIIYLALRVHGLPLYYSFMKAYTKVRNR